MALIANVTTQVSSLIPNIVSGILPTALAKFSELILGRCGDMIKESLAEHPALQINVNEMSSTSQCTQSESIYRRCEQLIEQKLSLSFHPSTVLGASEDILAEVVFDLMRAAAQDALLIHNAAFEFSGRYVQLQCLSKTEYNGLVGFVLGSVSGARFAVFVPSLGFRLSLTGDKLRVLSTQEFEKEHERHWAKFKPEYHIMVSEQKVMFEKEQRSSMADAAAGSVFNIKR